ncbi:MAG: flagellin [Gemmatimonadetes bacterium]|jgi:flagellin|nr:flagellin [Gemmatimonadota bacterium]MBT4612022.1 flagellin [Gemmatimonadota bacterium]MBT5060462.1 flagellin [Gemmatimonadota bacterium]MBT5142567.1 flagellin [Gemmatimonadota bacterium]MBT5592078.1 flagellin [Gemmatimonadota bacterium]
MPNAMNVNHNFGAINVRRHLNTNMKDQSMRLERLSSGMRINSAEDDAAGLTISEGFRAQITGLTMGVRNAEQGSNLLQVAEGSLNEVSSMLIRMRELAVQSSNSTVNDRNRESIEAEVSQLKSEIDRIAQSTVYNDQTILTGFGARADETISTAITDEAMTGVARVSTSGTPTGTYTFVDAGLDGELTLGNGTVTQTISMTTQLDTGLNVATGSTVVANFDRLGVQVTLAGHGASSNTTGSYVDGELDGKTIVIVGGTGGSFQVGADNVVEDRIEVGIQDMRASAAFLNLNSVSLSTQFSSRTAITQLDQAIGKVAQVRGDLGAAMNRLQHTISFTEGSIENNTNSEGSIRDADIATEVTAFSKIQVMTQAATSMLAQANLTPQGALQLIGN